MENVEIFFHGIANFVYTKFCEKCINNMRIVVYRVPDKKNIYSERAILYKVIYTGQELVYTAVLCI